MNQKNISGVTYYKLDKRYEGDVTKNCGLTGTEIDANFHFLRGREIKTFDFEENCLKIELLDGSYFVVSGFTDYIVSAVTEIVEEDIQTPSLSGSSYDDNEGVLTISINGEDYQIGGFATKNDFGVYVARGLKGNGTECNPIRMPGVNDTGVFAPVDEFFVGRLEETNKSKEKRYLTKEKVSPQGFSYNFEGVQKVQEILATENSGWRIPTFEEWAGMLNGLEYCDEEYKNHNNEEEGFYGKMAGFCAKSDVWQEDPLGDNSIKIYPTSINPYEAILWSSSINGEQVLTKKLVAASGEVRTVKVSKLDFYPIRLIRDIDCEGNGSDIVTINGAPYDTVEMLHEINGEVTTKLWTKTNIAISLNDMSLYHINGEEEFVYKYFVNEYDHILQRWLKKELKPNYSVIVKNFNGRENEEVVNHNGELAIIWDRTKNYVDEKVSSEAEQRESADSELSSRIQESTESLSNAIIEESEAREHGDNDIMLAVNETADSIREEISEKENELKEEIRNTKRELNQEISTEAQERESADNALLSRIEQTEHELYETIERESQIRERKDEELKSDIQNTEAELREEISQSESELRQEISGATESLKNYVNETSDSIREEIRESASDIIDIIDEKEAESIERDAELESLIEHNEESISGALDAEKQERIEKDSQLENLIQQSNETLDRKIQQTGENIVDIIRGTHSSLSDDIQAEAEERARQDELVRQDIRCDLAELECKATHSAETLNEQISETARTLDNKYGRITSELSERIDNESERLDNRIDETAENLERKIQQEAQTREEQDGILRRTIEGIAGSGATIILDLGDLSATTRQLQEQVSGLSEATEDIEEDIDALSAQTIELWEAVNEKEEGQITRDIIFTGKTGEVIIESGETVTNAIDTVAQNAGGGGGDEDIEDDPSLEKLVVTVDGVQYLVDREKFEAPAPPTISQSGTFTGNTTVTMISSVSGAQVRYTIGENSEPDDPTKTTGNVGTSISLSQNNNASEITYYIKAIAVKNGLVSSVASGEYVIKSKVSPVSIGNATGNDYSESRSVTITCPTAGSIIKYTTDGTDPRTSSTANIYFSPVSLNTAGTFVIKAYSEKDGWVSSDVKNSNSITVRKIQSVSISASGNEYSNTRTITMACNTSGVEIHYTKNGSTPTASSPIYDSSNMPIITESGTIKAIAIKEGWTNSNVASQSYTVGKPAMHYGYAGETINVSEIESLEGYKETSSPVGTYESTTSVQAYLWICIDPSQTIHTIKSNGFDVPMLEPTTIGKYKCYRSAVLHAVGTIEYVIS